MLSRITPATPTVCPVDINLIRQHARIDQDYGDDLIGMYAIAATDLAESMTNRFFLQRQIKWQLSEDRKQPTFYGSMSFSQAWYINLFQIWLHLPHSAISIDSVAVGDWNTDGSETALVLDTDYHIDIATDPARVKLLSFNQFSWQHNHMTINYTSGYADTSDDVPMAIKIAIMSLTAKLFETRGDEEGAIWTSGAENLLAPYTVNRFGGSSDFFDA